MFNKLLVGSLFALGLSSTAASAAYIPDGMSFDVATTTVEDWGFSECFSENSLNFGRNSVNGIKSACSSDDIIFGVRDAVSKTFAILALGSYETVFNYTPYSSSGALDNWSGGVNWYLNERSFGFTSSNYISQKSADTNLKFSGVGGVSVHVTGGEDNLITSTPWSYSKQGSGLVGINTGSFEVVFLKGSADVPVSFALGGLGLLGLSFRRKNKTI